MKRSFLVFAMLLTLASVPSFSTTQTPAEIPLREVINPDGRPRGSSPIPIVAALISNTIYLTFEANLGEIDVVLEESSEGIILQTSVDTSTLSAIIPFNAAPGEYCITFTLPSGSVYEGCFEI